MLPTFEVEIQRCNYRSSAHGVEDETRSAKYDLEQELLNFDRVQTLTFLESLTDSDTRLEKCLEKSQ